MEMRFVLTGLHQRLSSESRVNCVIRFDVLFKVNVEWFPWYVQCWLLTSENSKSPGVRCFDDKEAN
jgi:hypothetical protein